MLTYIKLILNFLYGKLIFIIIIKNLEILFEYVMWYQ